MTEKLYYQDAYLTEFTATVLECRPIKEEFAVILDRSAFYPEGGGQPGDTGSLNGIPVTDTQEREGLICHYTAQAIAPGTAVTGKVNWARRFDHMQQHTGEHIVSGIICSRFACDNVGFHMGSDLVTIDFNHEISVEEMLEVERKANAYIAENHPVEVSYPDAETLKTLPYRSKKELEGEVRIVTLPGSDCCACCGTHVAASAQVGLVKFLSTQKFREGSRLTLLCGGRAVEYLARIWQQNTEISHLLSAKPEETFAAVSRLKDEADRLHYQLIQLQEQGFQRRAEELAGCGNVLLFEEGLDPNGLRKLMTAVMERCGGRCAVFNGSGENWQYAIGEKGGDLRTLVKEMNSAFSGRGGGKPEFAQGSLTADRAQLEEFFAGR